MKRLGQKFGKRHVLVPSFSLSDKTASLPRRIVSILLVRGTVLHEKYGNGIASCYCKFRAGLSKYRSRTCFRTFEPQWNEHFEMDLKNENDGSHDLSSEPVACAAAAAGDNVDEQRVRVEVFDWHRAFADSLLGQAIIDLSQFSDDKIYDVTVPVENIGGAAGDTSATGCLELRLCITTAVPGSSECGESPENDARARLHAFDADVYGTMLETMRNKYSLGHTMCAGSSWSDVGMLAVRVIRASDLLDRDITSKSDPFCVLELGDQRRTTHVVRNNLNPEWNAYFEIPVHDIHMALMLTVYDEDDRGTHDFLGKLAVPLLQVQNGVPTWYTLKSPTLLSTTIVGSANEASSYGSILLELTLFYNSFKAAWQTIQPRNYLSYDEPDLNKFSVKAFGYNVTRISRWLTPLADIAAFVRSIMQWESKPRTLTFFSLYILVVSLFEPWMLPAVIFLVLFFCMMRSAMAQQRAKRRAMRVTASVAAGVKARSGGSRPGTSCSSVAIADDDLDLMLISHADANATSRAASIDSSISGGGDGNGKRNFFTSSFKTQKKIRTVAKRAKAKLKRQQPPTPQQRHSLVEFRNKALAVQRLMQQTADFVEQLANTFAFIVPWLSYGAMLALVVAAVILYLVNVRVILIAWGLFKITTRLPRPAGPSHLEVYAYLSRSWTEHDRLIYANTAWPDASDTSKGADDKILGRTTEALKAGQLRILNASTGLAETEEKMSRKSTKLMSAKAVRSDENYAQQVSSSAQQEQPPLPPAAEISVPIKTV